MAMMTTDGVSDEWVKWGWRRCTECGEFETLTTAPHCLYHPPPSRVPDAPRAFRFQRRGSKHLQVAR